MEKNKSLLPNSASLNQAGHLTVAGHEIDELVQKWDTPLYIYDAATIRDKIRILQDAGKKAYAGKFEITYAAKAYFSLGFARHLAQAGIGVDVVSFGEMAIARKAGFNPDQVHLHGNNKSDKELSAAVDWGVHSIVVDSLEELALLEEIADSKHKVVRIWFRITPGVDVDTHPYLQTGHAASKFGLPIPDGQAAQAIRQAVSSKWIDLIGLHLHVGSQVVQPEPYQRAIINLIELAEAENFVPKQISAGGGWGVQYLLDDPVGDVAEWINSTASTLQEECEQRDWPLPELVLEPGRWLSARAGLAVYRVGVTKYTESGHRMVAIDGGMSDNPRPALYDAEYTAFLVDRLDAAPAGHASLVGKFCESGDILISDIELPEVKRGELIAVPVSGAYQLSMASNYNLAPRPAVLWLEPGGVEVLQKREDPEESGWWVD